MKPRRGLAKWEEDKDAYFVYRLSHTPLPDLQSFSSSQFYQSEGLLTMEGEWAILLILT